MGLETKENYLKEAWDRKVFRTTELNCGQGKQGQHFRIIASQ